MLALPLLLALAGLPPRDPPVARVDAVEITRVDVVERLRVMTALRRPQTAQAAVSDLVEEALLAAEARRLGLDRAPEVGQALARERRRLAAEALVARMTPEPTEADLLELYHLTSDALRLVLVKTTTEEEARGVLQRVQAGGDLGAEARRGADPGLAARSGQTGLVSRAAVDPALAEQAFRAEPGALVGPVQLRLGWAVARVEERRLGDEREFPARRDAIASFAREKRRGQARTMVVERLKQKYAVTLDEAFLGAAGKAGPPAQRDLDRAVASVNGKPIAYRVVHEAAAGAAAGRHAGSALVSYARAEIDARLLDEEARAQGLDAAPAVAATLAGIERYLLATAAAERIAARPGADRADPVVRKRLAALRAAAAVRVDEPMVAAIQKEAR